MRKNLIAMSVAAFVGGLGMAGGAAAAVFADTTAGAVTDATAEVVRAGGTGHQLIVPYYNTQAGNATLFNIVNTDTTNAKAVKIRFRGGSNSDDVFDFQLYLSPGDVWAANISRGADGRAFLTTTDKSCTLPAGVGSGAGSSFVTARLPQTLTGDALNRETREGYIEIFNMADIAPGTALFTAVKHVNGVAPCTVATMNTLQTDPANVGAALALGFRAPTTGLFANWTIVNVPKSGSSSGEATAITAVTSATVRTPARGNIVFFPQVNGAVANPDFYTADPLFRTTGVTIDAVPAGGTLPALTAQFFDLPDLSTPYLLLGAYPPVATDPALFVNLLQDAIATGSISNEFLTDTSINAFTDWVFSQPTRRYSVAADYRSLPTAIRRAYLTGSAYYNATNTSISGFQICATTAGVSYTDREEFTAVGNNFVISPNPPAPGFQLCGETSVLTFNSVGASVLGAELARTNFSTLPVRDGWAVVSTPGIGSGLPILGKAFSSAATTTFNIGGSWEHRYTPTFP